MKSEDILERSRKKHTEDELVGTISFNSIIQQWVFSYRENYNDQFMFPHENENDVVCIVLESPHIKEFDGVNLQSSENRQMLSRPLNNPTSRNGLSRMLNSSSFNSEFSLRLDRKAKFDVVLVNAVQYQCSLGDKDTSKYRDDAFILNWVECQNTFVDRIKKINPSLIINCCTKGTWRDDRYINESRLVDLGLEFSDDSAIFQTRLSKNRKDFTLKDLVECKLINEGLINESTYFRYDHPSSLISKEPRDIRASDKFVASEIEFVGVSWKKKQIGDREDQIDLKAVRLQNMKKRFFFGKEAIHPENGMTTCEKLFVLTEEGYLYCEVDLETNYAVDDEAHDFESFDPSLYKWGGYQAITEIDEEEAKNTELKDQKNWISTYLSWRDSYRYISIDHMTSHYLGVKHKGLVLADKRGVSIAKDDKTLSLDRGIEEKVYEFLIEQINTFEDMLEIHPKNGPIGTRPATRTMFGRVILQPDDYNFNPKKPIAGTFILSKYTLENVRHYIQKNANS